MEGAYSSLTPNLGVTSSLSPGPSQPKPLRVHLPALDGVRAIAILMVIVYHALNGLPAATGSQNVFLNVVQQGWVGVDLFFVLSGFLITGILMDVRDPVHALRRFYARRMLRIVPVYVAFLLFSMWIAPIIGTMHPEEVAQLKGSQLWYWSYSFNLMVALHTWQATSFPLAHLWSLSVEEQFYLLWPLAALLMTPLTLRRTALGCIVAAELFRLAFILGGAGGQVNFVMLPCRMDSLAAGAFLACAYRDPALWSRCCAPECGSRSLRLCRWSPSRSTVTSSAARPRSNSSSDFRRSSRWRASSLPPRSAASHGCRPRRCDSSRRSATGCTSAPCDHAPDRARAAHSGPRVAAAVVGLLSRQGERNGVWRHLLALLSWYAIEQPFLRLKRFVPAD